MGLPFEAPPQDLQALNTPVAPGPNPEGALAPTPEMSQQIVATVEQEMNARIAADGVPSATNQGVTAGTPSTRSQLLQQAVSLIQQALSLED